MKITQLSRKQRFNSGFLAGLVAGILATALMLLLSATLGGISLPEVFGSALTQLMPASVFDYLHQLIGGDAKHYFFYIILIGQCLVFALIGGLASLALPLPPLASLRDEQEQWLWPAGLLLALLLWLLVGLVFLPLTGAGIFGAQLNIGTFNTLLSLAVDGLAFGLLFVFFQNWLIMRYWHSLGTMTAEDMLEASENRRQILRRGLAVVGVATLGVLAWRFITSAGTTATTIVPRVKSKIIPPPTPRYGTFSSVPGLSSEITSNDQYYVVSKNLVSDPTVAASSWQLKVYGKVTQPYTLTYDQIMALPRKQQYESMMCISNEVGGPYMSNALWEGIPLADLLTRAGKIAQGASKVVLHATDDYADSIHLTKALEPTTLVALRMNDATLPQGHGFPARLLVPGIYGMKHVKWITGIEVVDNDFQGYWQQRGWSDPAPIRLTSRIDTPLTGATLKANKDTYIAGVAFSGNKGISEVDVSMDGGKTWSVATLKQPPSNLTWVLWELPWKPAAGNHTLVVRAVDMEGNVQDPSPAPPAPDGSSGYHTIAVMAQ
ncbi:hypothetical protein KSF_033000 [Reticulibacter mediterranei]|uniref:Molybdopterin-binding oxidoreductase n=1 Tax=Reticulibacter mediterranei TaxID=2778369 RepID=A0A8J3IL45_9CHLR|nr:molybdopterin-dependent oxidoreductase [Reticulibacter mediterranei]GHO93252.1 hypothetical protein KSF_033000 [Reticulibacter mediterranei]